jgi:hypothetical protein
VAANSPPMHVIDEAHRTIMEAIDISEWIGARVTVLDPTSRPVEEAAPGNAAAALAVAPEPRGRELGVFISHAGEDGAIAERIAMGLTAFGHRSWYADWELEPGDSIVTRIEAALADSDTLLVVLSSRSVASAWVRQELNTALMAQLSSDHDIDIIPVLIDECEVPGLLRDRVYADLRQDFEVGLLQLLEILRRRRRRRPERVR